MRNLRTATAFAMLLAAAPAAAQIPVSVPPFHSIELQGGGRVIVRHGAEQRVMIVRGDPEMSRFTVDRDGQLEIDACLRSCRRHDLLVEIVTPELDGIAISGGGTIRAEGSFPVRRQLALAVDGGGELDASAIEAGSVAAVVDGGGLILTHARGSLTAAIGGGGAIRYRGDPSVTAAIDGGGTVNAIGD